MYREEKSKTHERTTKWPTLRGVVHLGSPVGHERALEAHGLSQQIIAQHRGAAGIGERVIIQLDLKTCFTQHQSLLSPFSLVFA